MKKYKNLEDIIKNNEKYSNKNLEDTKKYKISKDYNNKIFNKKYYSNKEYFNEPKEVDFNEIKAIPADAKTNYLFIYTLKSFKRFKNFKLIFADDESMFYCIDKRGNLYSFFKAFSDLIEVKSKGYRAVIDYFDLIGF